MVPPAMMAHNTGLPVAHPHHRVGPSKRLSSTMGNSNSMAMSAQGVLSNELSAILPPRSRPLRTSKVPAHSYTYNDYVTTIEEPSRHILSREVEDNTMILEEFTAAGGRAQDETLYLQSSFAKR